MSLLVIDDVSNTARSFYSHWVFLKFILPCELVCGYPKRKVGLARCDIIRASKLECGMRLRKWKNALSDQGYGYQSCLRCSYLIDIGDDFMGLMVLVLLASLVASCALWLMIGNKLPLNSEEKFPPLSNIAFYALGLFLPIYLIFFALGLW